MASQAGSRSALLAVLTVAACLAGACVSACDGDGGNRSLPATPRWAYVLQGDVAAEIAVTGFNVVVMDYTKDGTDEAEQRYAPAEMASIKAGGSRLALAYLSIGEAEEYRYYFDQGWRRDVKDGQPGSDVPAWLGLANPDWAGNYKVQYWSEEWQQLILGYVDKIIDYGFDGAYLDIVDGFEYWSGEENGEGLSLTEADAAARMIAFVQRIGAHARTQDPDFVLVPQNGERLLEYDVSGDYLRAIDGVGVEDLFYDERSAEAQAATEERLAYLELVLAVDKPVMVVDYVYAGSRDVVVDDFVRRASAAGCFPYAAATGRELDQLVVFAGQGE